MATEKAQSEEKNPKDKDTDNTLNLAHLLGIVCGILTIVLLIPFICSWLGL